MIYGLILLSFFSSAFAASIKCNGSEASCDRKYDDLTYPTTHNATSVRQGPGKVVFVANQDEGVEKQLKDGIRAFMIDLYIHKKKVSTCHKICLLGNRPFSETLDILREFLERNPHEVITLLLESHVSGFDIEKSVKESELINYVYDHLDGQEWPTLRSMIQKNKRLVVFTEIKNEGPSWLLPLYDHAFETDYQVSSSKKFDCEMNRGLKGNSFFILNNFVTRALGRKSSNKEPNKLSFILSRSEKCQQETGHRPNFIAVDFYAQGELVKATQILNQKSL